MRRLGEAAPVYIAVNILMTSERPLHYFNVSDYGNELGVLTYNRLKKNDKTKTLLLNSNTSECQ